MMLPMAYKTMYLCMLNLAGRHKMIIIVMDVSKPQLHETPQTSPYFPVWCIMPCISCWTLISLALAEIWMKNFLVCLCACVCVCMCLCVYVFVLNHHGTICSPQKFFLDSHWVLTCVSDALQDTWSTLSFNVRLSIPFIRFCILS